MKVVESNLSAELFDHSRYMICTSAAIQGHLLRAYYSKNIFLRIIDTTESTIQPLNFYLCEMPKKFVIKYACKIDYGSRCAGKNYEYICIEY